MQAWTNLGDYVRGLFDEGGSDPRADLIGTPWLNPIPAALLALGLGYMLARLRWRRAELAMAWIWAAVYLVYGAASPDAIRVYGFYPAAILIGATALDVIWSAWQQADAISAEHLASPLLFALAAWAALHGVTSYFADQVRQPGVWDAFNAAQTQAALTVDRITRGAGESWRIFMSHSLLEGSPLTAWHPELRVSPMRQGEDIPPGMETAGHLLYLASEGEARALDLLESLYPEGWREQVRDTEGRTRFDLLVIPAEAAGRRGLHESVWAGSLMAGPPVRERPLVDPTTSDGEASPRPMTRRLTGGIRLPTAGAYRFRLVPSDGTALLHIADQLIAAHPEIDGTGAESEAIWLPAGLLPLRVDQILPTAQSPLFPIEWLPPEGDRWQPIPLAALWPVDPPSGGWVAAFYEGDQFRVPEGLWLDPQIIPFEGEGAHAMRWRGTLNVQTPGRYEFYIQADGGASLYVNGQPVIELWNLGRSEGAGKITLEAGEAAIEMTYFSIRGTSGLAASWRAPGQPWSPLHHAPVSWQPEDVRVLLAQAPAARPAIPCADGAIPLATAEVKDRRWPDPQADANFQGHLLKAGGRAWKSGIGVFGPSDLHFSLDGRVQRLSGFVGVDLDTPGDGVAWFEILVDGQVVWQSGPVRRDDAPLRFDESISGGRTLTLRTHEGEALGQSDGADWLDLRCE
ncbi:MAG: hypothetical protein Kow0047_32640 [Anaerolineae bacterium]